MIMSDKKKPAALIVARMSEGKPDAESEAPKNEMGDQVDDSVAKESAAEELLSALESKSPKAVAEAFDAMMELCGKYSEEED